MMELSQVVLRSVGEVTMVDFQWSERKNQRKGAGWEEKQYLCTVPRMNSDAREQYQSVIWKVDARVLLTRG